jgi:hypothetical protein
MLLAMLLHGFETFWEGSTSWLCAICVNFPQLSNVITVYHQNSKKHRVFLILSTDCSNRRNSLLGLFEHQFLLFETDRGVEEGSFQIEGELSDNSWSNFYLWVLEYKWGSTTYRVLM